MRASGQTAKKAPAEAGRREEATLGGASAGFRPGSASGDAADLGGPRLEAPSPRGVIGFHDRDARRQKAHAATHGHGEWQVKPTLG
jgi:hypothetical protein